MEADLLTQGVDGMVRELHEDDASDQKAHDVRSVALALQRPLAEACWQWNRVAGEQRMGQARS